MQRESQMPQRNLSKSGPFLNQRKTKMNTLPTYLNLPEVSLESLLWNLLTCTILSLVMCWHFNMRSKNAF